MLESALEARGWRPRVMFVNINNHVFLDSALKWAVLRYCRLSPPLVILCSIESNQRRGGMNWCECKKNRQYVYIFTSGAKENPDI